MTVASRFDPRQIVREPTLAERFDPRPADDARYETAIARRNTTYVYWREAQELLEEVRRRPLHDTRPYVQNLNAAAGDYERACYDLIREKVRWERDGVPW